MDSPAWLQVLGEFFDDLVPVLVPAKTGTRAVQVIYTSSEEDKDLLKVTSRILFLVIIGILLHVTSIIVVVFDRGNSKTLKRNNARECVAFEK